MDEYSAGVITFERLAGIINNHAYDKTEVTPRQEIVDLTEDLTEYFKSLSNVDFDEDKFKKLCLD